MLNNVPVPYVLDMDTRDVFLFYRDLETYFIYNCSTKGTQDSNCLGDRTVNRDVSLQLFDSQDQYQETWDFPRGQNTLLGIYELASLQDVLL